MAGAVEQVDSVHAHHRALARMDQVGLVALQPRAGGDYGLGEAGAGLELDGGAGDGDGVGRLVDQHDALQRRAVFQVEGQGRVGDIAGAGPFVGLQQHHRGAVGDQDARAGLPAAAIRLGDEAQPVRAAVERQIGDGVAIGQAAIGEGGLGSLDRGERTAGLRRGDLGRRRGGTGHHAAEVAPAPGLVPTGREGGGVAQVDPERGAHAASATMRS